MQGKIIVGLLLCYLFSGVSMPAIAESKLGLPFKSPFSIFSNKDEEAPKAGAEEKLNAKVEETEKKLKPRVDFNPDNTLGIAYAENAIDKVKFYIEEDDFQSAQEALNPVNEWIYNATEYHTDLYKALKKVNNSEVQAEIERDLAIKFAVLRDKALFLESKILLAKGNKRRAVENLVEVVRSQPGTALGFDAYKALQEIGFTYKVEYESIQKDTDKQEAK